MTTPHDYALPITKEWLLEHKASPDQVVFFLKKWPQGMDMTRESLQTPGLDLKWFMRELVLPISIQAKFERTVRMARDKYDSVSMEVYDTEINQGKAVAYAEFSRVIAADSAKSDQIAAAHVKYDRAVDVAHTKYRRIIDQLWAEFERSMTAAKIDAILHFIGDNR